MGGKDAASPRYIFTKLAPITRLIFREEDDALLKYLDEDGDTVEPLWYMPIIPMVLVNGSEGIGTGWSSQVPNYNPRDLIKYLRAKLDGTELPAVSLTPSHVRCARRHTCVTAAPPRTHRFCLGSGDSRATST